MYDSVDICEWLPEPLVSEKKSHVRVTAMDERPQRHVRLVNVQLLVAANRLHITAIDIYSH